MQRFHYIPQKERQRHYATVLLHSTKLWQAFLFIYWFHCSYLPCKSRIIRSLENSAFDRKTDIRPPRRINWINVHTNYRSHSGQYITSSTSVLHTVSTIARVATDNRLHIASGTFHDSANFGHDLGCGVIIVGEHKEGYT